MKKLLMAAAMATVLASPAIASDTTSARGNVSGDVNTSVNTPAGDANVNTGVNTDADINRNTTTGANREFDNQAGTDSTAGGVEGYNDPAQTTRSTAQTESDSRMYGETRRSERDHAADSDINIQGSAESEMSWWDRLWNRDENR